MKGSLGKYLQIVEESKSWFWQVQYEPIEIGGRGFDMWSLCKMFVKIRSDQNGAEEASR